MTHVSITPRLINAKDGSRVPVQQFEKINVSNSSLEIIRDAMFAAVNQPGSTGYNSRIFNTKFMLSGKTGTAQVRRITSQEREIGVTKNEDLPWEMRDHALFTGFAPSNNPKYAISVVVEHGGSASRVAAPIARDIILYALHDKFPPLLSYPPDQRNDVRNLLGEVNDRLKTNPDPSRGVNKKYET